MPGVSKLKFKIVGVAILTCTLSMNTVLSPPARSVPTKLSVWAVADAVNVAVYIV